MQTKGTWLICNPVHDDGTLRGASYAERAAAYESTPVDVVLSGSAGPSGAGAAHAARATYTSYQQNMGTETVQGFVYTRNFAAANGATEQYEEFRAACGEFPGGATAGAAGLGGDRRRHSSRDARRGAQSARARSAPRVRA